jgi:ribosome biogenesis GTPase
VKGLVVKNTGSWYQVKTEGGRLVETKLKGNFRLKGIQSTNPVSVGDRVFIEENPEGTALIYEIEDRKNYIIRRSSNLSKQSHIIASNLDHAFLIATVNYPVTTTTFIDRFLAAAEAYRIPVVLFFNKIDCYNVEDKEYMNALIHLYETIGYPCYQISALEATNLSFMQVLLKDKITLFSGHSGVGKSTIINCLVPGTSQKTQEISGYHNKGMHTTTFSEMIELPQGGYIIDTPGIKGFGVFDMEGVEISHYFPEIFRFSHDCRFNNCSHRKEPGCAVRKAVEEHFVSESRYRSYLNMLEDKHESKYREAF